MGQISKLNYVDGRLGAPTSGQQTTRVIFNTIKTPGSGNLTFFKTFQGLTNGQTNLTTNKLDSAESMVVKSIWLAAFNNNGALISWALNRSCNVSVVVGNQIVVKNLPVHFNSGISGQTFDRLHAVAGVNLDSSGSVAAPDAQNQIANEIRLLTDVVIPPQVNFEVRIEAPGSGLNNPFGNANTIVCALSGYGKIFSAGSSF